MSDTPNGPENKVPNTAWQDPYTREEFLTPDLIASLSASLTQKSDAEARTAQLIAQGYKTYAEAGEITGLDAHAVLQSRARAIEPDENYTLQGLKPAEGAAAIKGSTLVWKHPTAGSVLLHPQLVEGWRDAEITQKNLEQRKFLSVQKAAQQLGVSYMLIYKRATKIESGKEYSPEGLEPKDGGTIVKGNELVWKHPYSRSREGNLLVSPTLIDAWHNIFKRQEQLRATGYKTLEEAAAITGLDRGGIIETRARKIQSDKRYTFDGSEPTDSSPESVLGGELVWRDPYGSTGAVGVLLHPRLVDAWQADKVEENTLREAGYKTYVETEQLTGINRRVLEARVALIKPEQEYTFEQNLQTQDKTTIQGDKLVWRSRYSSTSGTSVLIHPVLAEFWKQQEGQEKELRGKGYKTITEASEIIDIPKGTITARIGKITPSVDYLSNGLKPEADGQPTIKGGELIWRGSYQVLLHPELVEGWKSVKLKEGELIKQGYKTTEEAAQIANIDKGTTVLLRASSIDPERDYNLQGQVPKDDEAVIKGKELVWKNPYSRTNSSGKTGILIHPQLVESWKNTAFWRREIDEEERALRAKGYVDITYIETQYGISPPLGTTLTFPPADSSPG